MRPAQPSRARDRLPQALAASAALVVLLFAGVLVRVYDGEPTGPFLVGASVSSGSWPIRVAEVPGPGFDGQFFLALGLDPFLQSGAADRLDDPRYRARRIAWPLTAWMLSLGRLELVPFALIALNLLAIWGGSAGIALWARQHGENPYWGLVYAANLGNIVCISRMTADGIVAGLLIGVTLLAAKRTVGSTMAAAGVLGLAALQKETALLALPILLIPAIQLRDWRPRIALGAALAIVAGWWAYVAAVSPPGPIGLDANFDLPGRGLLIEAETMLEAAKSPIRKGKDLAYWGVEVAAILGSLLYWKKILRSPLSGAGLFASIALFGVLGAILGGNVWTEPWSYARVLLPMTALLLLASLGSPTGSPPTRLQRLGKFAALAQGVAGIAFALSNLLLAHP